jgi:uncharacterized membrane protein
MAAPLFILLPVVWRSQARGLSLAALLILVMGTTGAFIAVATGDAAEELAEGARSIDRVLHQHEETAEAARNYFLVATIVYAALWAAPLVLRKRFKPGWFAAGSIVIAVACVPGLLILANAAHLGGRLVHELGVHALMPPSNDTAPPAGGKPAEDHE